jgi:hypothetical protein
MLAASQIQLPEALLRRRGETGFRGVIHVRRLISGLSRVAQLGATVIDGLT